MRTAILAFLSSVAPLALLSDEAKTAPKIGDVVFEKTFDKDLAGWSDGATPWAKIVPDGRGGACVEIKAGTNGGSDAVVNRDVFGNLEKAKGSSFLLSAGVFKALEACKGCELEIEAGVSAKDVPPPPKPWLGIKLAINYATSTSPYSDCCYNMLSGSFDWRKLSWKVRVPSDLTNASVSLGLAAPSGEARFDHVKITVTDLPFSSKTPPGGTPFTGRQVPRLRGFGTGVREPGSEQGKATLRDLSKSWKANVVKLWFGMDKADFDNKSDAKLKKWMDSVEAALETAREERLYLILIFSAELKTPERGGNELFYEKPEYGERLVEMWRAVAEKFKGRKEIYAFELLNESVRRLPPAEGCPDYPELMERVAKAVNEVDPDRALLVEPEEWWSCRAFSKMRPLNAKNVIYAAHFYSPFQVSHQGINAFLAGGTSWTACAYPGVCDGVKWDKETLRREMQPVVEFQKATNSHVMVSEFSCVRWALGDSRRKLLSDMIDLFEEQGWDWLYHSHPGWPAWDPRLNDDPWDMAVPEKPSATELLLKRWFEKNRRPEFPDAR